MSELILTNTQPTMTSREIADLVESRHDTVKISIDRLVKSGVISHPSMTDGIRSANGTKEKSYVICKRDTYIIVAQLSPAFTAKLVDRWQELESQQASVISLPNNFLEALKLLVEKEEENIQLKLDVSTLDATLTKQAPAVEFAMAVRNLDGSCDIGEFAGVIGVGRNTLFKKMREDKLLMITNRPYQKFKDNGVFVEIENIPFVDRQGKSHPTFQTRVTGKGQILLENKYRSLNPFYSFMEDTESST